MNLLDELTYMGKYLGSRIDLVQAGGGNISIKDGNNLYIKSSGCILSEIDHQCGYTVVDLKKTSQLIDNLELIPDENFGHELNKLIVENGRRPSIETPLHALIENKIVIHVHPICVIAMTGQTDSESQLKKLFPNSVWVKYATPGKRLAINFMNVCKNNNSIYFLQNHGVVISGKNILDVLHYLEKVIDKCSKQLSYQGNKRPSEIMDMINRLFKRLVTVYESDNKDLVQKYIEDNKIYKPLCPDDVVYIGPEILNLNDLSIEGFQGYFSRYQTLPKVVFVDNKFYFIDSNLTKARHIAEQLYANLSASSLINDHCKHFIDEKEIKFLSNWEAEKYRKKSKGSICN